MLVEAKRFLPSLPRAVLVPFLAVGAMALETVTHTPIVEAGGGCQAGIYLGLPQEPTGRVPCPDEFVWDQVSRENNRPIVLGISVVVAALLCLRQKRISDS